MFESVVINPSPAQESHPIGLLQEFLPLRSWESRSLWADDHQIKPPGLRCGAARCFRQRGHHLRRGEVAPRGRPSGDATVLADSSRLEGAAETSMTKSGASVGFCGGS